jgi:signal peptidase II
MTLGFRNARWLGVSLAIIAADQITKLVVEHYTPKDFLRVVIPGFFNLVHRHNPGVAFGLLAENGSPWLTSALVAFSCLAVVLLGWLLLTGRAGGPRSCVGLALIVGGAAGNVVDRLMHGSVIDFLEFYFRGFHWPAFNVADSAIVVGAGLVILELLLDRRHHLKAEG